MLMDLMLLIGPPAIIICLAAAYTGTRIEKTPPPTAMVASFWQSNKDDSHHLIGE